MPSRYFTTPSGTVYRLVGETWSVWYTIVNEWAPAKLPAKAVDWLLELDPKPLNVPWADHAAEAVAADPVPETPEEISDWVDQATAEVDDYTPEEADELEVIAENRRLLYDDPGEELSTEVFPDDDQPTYTVDEMVKLWLGTKEEWTEHFYGPAPRYSVWVQVPGGKGWGELASGLTEAEANFLLRVSNYPISIQEAGNADQQG